MAYKPFGGTSCAGTHRLMTEAQLQTRRGKEKLAKDGYMYNFEKISRDGKRKMWRCSQRTGQSCHVRVHTDLTGQNILWTKHTHSHGSDAAQVELAKIKIEMKRKATETLETPEEILNSVLATTGVAIQGQLPSINAARKMVQRARNGTVSTLGVPQCLQDLVVPEEYRRFEMAPGEWEQFLLADAACEENLRLLIFGRQSCGTWADSMHDLVIDGTFKAEPPLFNNIFVISAKRGGFVMPILYALLPNTLRITFDTLFETIKLMWPHMIPTSVSMDYDTEVISSFQAAFPDVKFFGCLFHLTRNVLKRLESAGLLTRYENEVDFSFGVKMIFALAFVPYQDLNESFEALSSHLLDKIPDLEPILVWFEDCYLGRPIYREGRRTATFNQVVWHFHQQILDNQDATHERADACHRRLQSQLGMHHQSIWKFIETLRLIQRNHDQLYEQHLNGGPPQKKRDRFVRADDLILKLVKTYATRSRIDFLTAIAQNIIM